METREKVQEIVCEVLGERVEFDEESNLMYDYSMDSIQIMNVVVALEDEFDIEFELEELDIENLMVFSKLVEQTEKLVKEGE